MRVVQKVKVPEDAPYVTSVIRPVGLARIASIRQRDWQKFPIGSKVLIIKLSDPHIVDTTYYEGLKSYHQQKALEESYVKRKETYRQAIFDNLVQKPVKEPPKEDSSETSNKN